jgi:hypothetical protein
MDHAADEKVRQESLFSIGVPAEQGQFIFRVSDDLFLWQRGYSFFFSSLLTPNSFKNIAT